jgi:hypothetical protein
MRACKPFDYDEEVTDNYVHNTIMVGTDYCAGCQTRVVFTSIVRGHLVAMREHTWLRELSTFWLGWSRILLQRHLMWGTPLMSNISRFAEIISPSGMEGPVIIHSALNKNVP